MSSFAARKLTGIYKGLSSPVTLLHLLLVIVTMTSHCHASPTPHVPQSRTLEFYEDNSFPDIQYESERDAIDSSQEAKVMTIFEYLKSLFTPDISTDPYGGDVYTDDSYDDSETLDPITYDMEEVTEALESLANHNRETTHFEGLLREDTQPNSDEEKTDVLVDFSPSEKEQVNHIVDDILSIESLLFQSGARQERTEEQVATIQTPSARTNNQAESRYPFELPAEQEKDEEGMVSHPLLRAAKLRWIIQEFRRIRQVRRKQNLLRMRKAMMSKSFDKIGPYNGKSYSYDGPTLHIGKRQVTTPDSIFQCDDKQYLENCRHDTLSADFTKYVDQLHHKLYLIIPGVENVITHISGLMGRHAPVRSVPECVNQVMELFKTYELNNTDIRIKIKAARHNLHFLTCHLKLVQERLIAEGEQYGQDVSDLISNADDGVMNMYHILCHLRDSTPDWEPTHQAIDQNECLNTEIHSQSQHRDWDKTLLQKLLKILTNLRDHTLPVRSVI